MATLFVLSEGVCSDLAVLFRCQIKRSDYMPLVSVCRFGIRVN